MDNSIERNSELNIFQRINLVMQEVGHLEKDGQTTIKTKEGKRVGSYGYISHDAVTAHVRKSFIKHGIVVQPSVAHSEFNGNQARLTVQIDFINIDDPKDFITITTLGCGNDNQDKGPGKAFSYAVKYAYLKLLMLNSADDIEADNVDHDPNDHRQSATKAAQDESIRAREAAATTLKAAIDGAKSREELKNIKKTNKTTVEDLPEVTQKYFKDLFADREADFKEGEGS